MMLSFLLYLAAVIFLLGMGWRLGTWLRAPVTLRIVLTPAPKTATGVARRLAGEMFAFRSLFQADRPLWVPAWLFHVSLGLLFAGHLGGLVIPGVAETVLGLDESQFEQLAQRAGSVVGLLGMVSLLWLLVRRLAGERLRSLSTFGDYFALGLLLLIIGTGNYLRFLGALDIQQARQFVSGWLRFHPAAAPSNPVFAAHIIFVSLLLAYIPFSKLVHLGGAVLFSPTLNQREVTRELNPRSLGAPRA
jgi:nitrate reductase gamma subunit